jgi:hypothetical protein
MIEGAVFFPFRRRVSCKRGPLFACRTVLKCFVFLKAESNEQFAREAEAMRQASELVNKDRTLGVAALDLVLSSSFLPLPFFSKRILRSWPKVGALKSGRIIFPPQTQPFSALATPTHHSFLPPDPTIPLSLFTAHFLAVCDAS